MIYVVASIEGTLAISTQERRSLVTPDELDESETNDLIISTQETIEDIACHNFPVEYVCVVDILSVNNQVVTRRLRSASRHTLAGLLSFAWMVQVTLPTQDDGRTAEELANQVSTVITNDLNAASRDNSLVSTLISKANTSLVRSMNFGATTVEIEPPRVELRKTSSSRLSGGNGCSKDSQCESNHCSRGGGSCKWPKKCCAVSIFNFLFAIFILTFKY